MGSNMKQRVPVGLIGQILYPQKVVFFCSYSLVAAAKMVSAKVEPVQLWRLQRPLVLGLDGIFYSTANRMTGFKISLANHHFPLASHGGRKTLFQANVLLKSLIYPVCCRDQEFLLSLFILFLNFLEGEEGREIKVDEGIGRRRGLLAWAPVPALPFVSWRILSRVTLL